jgi:glycosyltransferase involved in cell wall biosynthesis
VSLRVLLVTDAYAPLIGGANRSTELLARQLIKRGDIVRVGTQWQPGLPEQEELNGIPVHRMKNLVTRVPWFSTQTETRHHPPFPDPETVWRFRRLLQEFKPDLVHSYGWITYSVTAAMLGTKIPLLVSARDYGNICAVRSLVCHGKICDGPTSFKKCLECSFDFYGVPKGTVAVLGVTGGKFLLRHKLRGLHSISRFVQSMMLKYLLNLPDEIHKDGLPYRILPNFREDLNKGVPDQQILSRLPNEPFILFVGALRTIKGMKPLLEAYQQLKTPPPLVLIGTNEYDTPKTFPPGVIVINDVPHPTVMAAWERALFGVTPSIWPEPLGNVVHEGMSKGRAMVGTFPGGQADMIVDGETGFLVLAGNVKSLAQAMQRLIDEPELRTKMGEASLKRAQLFTPELLWPGYEALYDQILAYAKAKQKKGSD